MKSRKPARTIVLKLPAEEYTILMAMAEGADRDAWQQARHLIRRGLGLVPPPEGDEDEQAPIEAAS